MTIRMTVFCVGLLVAVALSWLWPRIDRPPTQFEIARSLLDEGRPDDALLIFEEPIWRGIAEYRAGRYNRAGGEFFPAESTLELYNVGTTFARLEQWSGAIGALEKVLRLDPEHADARHNLEIVLKASELEEEAGSDNKGAPQIEQDGDQRQKQANAEKENPNESKQKGGAENETTSQEQRQKDELGNSDKPGELGDEEDKSARGTAVATGELTDDLESPVERDMTGSAELQARESTMAAEILLRQIKDDPERVLRVRLYTAHRARRPVGQE